MKRALFPDNVFSEKILFDTDALKLCVALYIFENNNTDTDDFFFLNCHTIT